VLAYWLLVLLFRPRDHVEKKNGNSGSSLVARTSPGFALDGQLDRDITLGDSFRRS